MAQHTVSVNGVKVASTHPQSTHVSIHIHQKSALEQLLEAVGSLKTGLSCPQATGPTKSRIHYGQLSLGVTQILLGLVSCVLGVCLYFGPWSKLGDSGCAFWSGSVAIVAGVGTIVHEKHQGKLSGHISRLLLLACIATAAAATVLGVDSLTRQTSAFYHLEISSACDSWQASVDSGYELERYTDWKTEKCREYLDIMMNLFLAFCILLTVVCILEIVVSVASLGLSLRSMCGRSSAALNDEETEKKLLGGDSVAASPAKEKIPVIL